MGYDLAIGELKVYYDNSCKNSTVSFDVEERTGRTEAFLNVGEFTDGTNMRSPSYGSWGNFSMAANLSDFFFEEEEGLMREHPGIFPISEYHREIINQKYKEFKDKYPDAKASYSDESNLPNCYMVRFEWLHYWVNWALDNCDRPVFQNH